MYANICYFKSSYHESVVLSSYLRKLDLVPAQSAWIEPSAKSRFYYFITSILRSLPLCFSAHGVIIWTKPILETIWTPRCVWWAYFALGTVSVVDCAASPFFIEISWAELVATIDAVCPANLTVFRFEQFTASCKGIDTQCNSNRPANSDIFHYLKI